MVGYDNFDGLSGLGQEYAGKNVSRSDRAGMAVGGAGTA